MYIKDGSNKSYGGQSSIKLSSNMIVNAVDRRRLKEDAFHIDGFEKIKAAYEEGRFHRSSMYFDEKLYMWGWLGDKTPTCGWKDDDEKRLVIKTLKGLSNQYRLDHHCGHHVCEVCGRTLENDKVTNTFNGSIYIKYKKRIYRCPDKVEHYIESHDYRPPKVVIDAILNGKFLSVSDFLEDFFNKHKKDIQMALGIAKEKEIERQRGKVGHERRMKRIEEKRTPEQRSVLKRLKDGALDLVGLNK